MSAHPVPKPKPSQAPAAEKKLRLLPPRQKPFYDSALDRQAVREKLLDPRKKFGVNWTRFYADAFRLSSGAAQAALLMGIFRRTIEGSRPAKAKAPEWTPAMLAGDFAREAGFTEQMMREAIADALERKVIERRSAESKAGPEAGQNHQYRLTIETWEKLPNAFNPRPKEAKDDGEYQEKTGETTALRKVVPAGATQAIGVLDEKVLGEGASPRRVQFRNETEAPMSIALTIPQAGDIEIAAKAAKVGRRSPQGAGAGRATPSPLTPAAPEHGPDTPRPVPSPKSKPGPAASRATMNPALVGARPAAEQIQDCMRDLRSPIMLSDAREIAGILHSCDADEPVDIQWFCTLVRQRAEREARRNLTVTFPVLKGMAQDAAKELWHQEAQRRRDPQPDGDLDLPLHPKDRERVERIRRGAAAIRRKYGMPPLEG